MPLRTLTPSAVKHKRVLVRIDVNIELDRRGVVRDRSRITAVAPTIRWLLRQRAAVVLISHRGRPQAANRQDLLRPMVVPLERAIRKKIAFIPGTVTSPITRTRMQSLRSGQIALLENIRFSRGEEQNSRQFARALSQLGDVYVNEAFSASHRAAASIVGITRYLPAYAGFRLEAEVRELNQLRRRPSRPYVAIVGGAKISTKLQLVRQLLRRADHVILGGALANTVLQVEGLAIGSSMSETAMLRQARGLTVKNKHLHIPCDVVVKRPGQRPVVKSVGRIARTERIVDIGPDSVDLFKRILSSARTIVWNGPMGVYEEPPFDVGTRAIARAVAHVPARSVVGGGETVDAVRRQGLERSISWLSTGGGAMLEFLEGKRLPGLAV